MAKEDKYSIRDLKKEFPNDNACLEYLFDTLHSRECSCGGKYALLKGRRQFQCSKCRFQISPQIGTIFEKSSTPLTLWFHAIFIFSNAKSGISSKELERQIGVTYKTAWRILSLIRKSLGQNNNRLSGDVEMDEGYFGGKGEGGKYNKNLDRVMKKKSIVIAAIERQGDMKAEVVRNTQAETIGAFLVKHVDPQGTRLMTDESNRYKLVAKAYDRFMVNHGEKEYVRDDIYVNNVESFWAHVKRSIKGTHKAISKKHLQSYLDAFVWLRNNRHNDRARFGSLLLVIVRL